MRIASYLSVCVVTAFGLNFGCGANGKPGSDAGVGSDGGGPGGDGGGSSMVPRAVDEATRDLRAACGRIDARNVACGAASKGMTKCQARTAAWFNSDKGFGPEVPDLSKLTREQLRHEFGVDEAECKAMCVETADCKDVVAEARDGACDGAPDYTGSLDACRDTCRDKFTGYACGDGKYLQDERVCDGMPDCANGNDEACTTDVFDCGAGVMLTRARAKDKPAWDPTCDDKVHCETTGKDEAGCDVEAFQCAPGAFVADDDVCDAKNQCENKSDEADCPEFDCGDGERIPARGVCDSDINCENHSDDLDCPGWFVCADGKGAVAGNDVCEISDLSTNELAALTESDLRKLYDCPDQSDEAGCARVICE